MPRPPSRLPAPELDGLLDRVEEALEKEQFAEALKLSEEVQRLAPGSVDGLHLRAASLVGLDRVQEAEEAYARALRDTPDDVDVLLGYADLLIAERGEERDNLEQAVALTSRGRKFSKKKSRPELYFEFALLEGIALNQMGECAGALERLDEALELDPDAHDARLERGLARFELCQFTEAGKDLSRVLEFIDDAFAHHYLGLIAERSGDSKEAKKRFARATELAPEDFPAPVRLSETEFDRAVEDAVERLPAHVKKYLENTTIAVEPIPSNEDLTSDQPPLSPCILGVFRGTPVGERSVANAFDHVTASIVLYQRNLERFARSRDELIEQIGITLMHEVGHLIGLDEEDLWERGLD